MDNACEGESQHSKFICYLNDSRYIQPVTMVLLFMGDGGGGGGGEQSKHSPCCMGNEYKKPLSHESRNSIKENWNAGKLIIWISKWKQKKS